MGMNDKHNKDCVSQGIIMNHHEGRELKPGLNEDDAAIK